MDYAGGQAVIEGVLIRYKDKIAISVRKGNRIITKREKLEPKLLRKVFFIRGVFNLVEFLILGMKALNWSANQQLGKEEKLSNAQLTVALLFSLAFAIGLFIFLPFFATGLLGLEQGVIFNVVDGLIRLIVFVLYVFIISFMADIKRLFQYHGAEHKSINCYEAGKKLTVENVKKYSTIHNRCGTTFIMIVLIVSIFVFSLITGNFFYQLLARIILIPVIASLSYEILFFLNKFNLRLFLWPGLLVQKITTLEPDKKQIQVAIVAVKNALR